jgi:diacylglycerol kinase (ATP)
MRKKITFIINPKSGTGKQKGIENKIKIFLDNKKSDFTIAYTSHRYHAIELAKEAAKSSDVVVAIGGDGTVNEVASALVGTGKPLGIIPTGSGNGIARNLGIPTDIRAAIELLNNFKTTITDTGYINGKAFFATAGCGFDAHISHKFSMVKKRGFFSYVKLILKEYKRFKPLSLSISINGNALNSSVFLATVANGKQFGNNACISPKAIINDGLLNLTLLRPFPFYAVPGIIVKLFSQKIDTSAFVETFEAKEITIQQQGNIAHYDGDFFESGESLTFSVLPASLNIAIANN